MSLSKIVISGRVVRAPEKRFTPNTNMAVTEFTILVDSLPAKDGSVESTPVKVITWRELAERLAAEVEKGDLVTVDGRLQINNFATSEGQKRREVEIDAIAVDNLSKKTSTQPQREEKGALAKAGAKAQNKPEDLDAIFANEDEIPF